MAVARGAGYNQSTNTNNNQTLLEYFYRAKAYCPCKNEPNTTSKRTLVNTNPPVRFNP